MKVTASTPATPATPNGSPRREGPDYWLATLRTGYFLKENLLLTAAVENLFDEEHPGSRIRPKRAWYQLHLRRGVQVLTLESGVVPPHSKVFANRTKIIHLPAWLDKI